MRGLAGAVLALALLAGCAGDGPDPARPVPVVDAPAALAERLPAEAAGFQRGATAPVESPFPGVEVSYATPGRHAAGYVQVLRPPGGAPLPDGTGAPEVAAEFQRWSAETARGALRSRRLSIVAEYEEPAAAPMFRCAALSGSYGRQPVQSQVCVGAAGGQLLRLRASMPRRDPPAADPRAFARGIVAGLRGLPPEPAPPLPAADAFLADGTPFAEPPPAVRPRPTAGARPPARAATPVRAAPRAGTTASPPARR